MKNNKVLIPLLIVIFLAIVSGLSLLVIDSKNGGETSSKIKDLLPFTKESQGETDSLSNDDITEVIEASPNYIVSSTRNMVTVRKHDTENFPSFLFRPFPFHMIKDGDKSEEYIVHEKDASDSAEKLLLSFAKNFDIMKCSVQVASVPQYVLLAENKELYSSSEKYSYYNVTDYDLYVYADYKGKDTVNGEEVFTFFINTPCPVGAYFAIPTMYENELSILKDLEKGVRLAFTGVFEKKINKSGYDYFGPADLESLEIKEF